MELRHLRYFVAVAEELHFGRAANRLQITQQPLSQQIHNLETELGVQLLHRTKRTVRLTAAGTTFLEGARRILAQAAQTVHLAQSIARGELGELEIGFTGPALSSLLPAIVQQFRERYPGIHLRLNELRTPPQVEALLKGELHAGLLHPPIDSRILNLEVVYRERLALVLPTSHRLAQSDNTFISLKDLKEEPFILFPRQIGPVLYDRIISMFQKARFSPNIVQEVTPQQTILSLVSVGIGLALMQESLSRIGHSGVVFKPLKEQSPELELAIAWHPDTQHPVLESFLNIVREVAAFERSKVEL
jgi:DNA-binding transcriptional LysR family regulator